MPDQTVQVRFAPPSSWHFDPPAVRMTAAGKVKLHQHPAHAAWKFMTAEVTGGGGQFSVAVSPSGTQLTVEDRCTSAGAFAYRVTVSQDGRQYTSGTTRLAADPPPTIENQPSGTGGPEGE